MVPPQCPHVPLVQGFGLRCRAGALFFALLGHVSPPLGDLRKPRMRDQEAQWHQVKNRQLLDLVMDGASDSSAGAAEEGCACRHACFFERIYVVSTSSMAFSGRLTDVCS